jgi:hypothetical protein
MYWQDATSVLPKGEAGGGGVLPKWQFFVGGGDFSGGVENRRKSLGNGDLRRF